MGKKKKKKKKKHFGNSYWLRDGFPYEAYNLCQSLKSISLKCNNHLQKMSNTTNLEI